MKFENTDVWGFEHAIRGMRNPLQSHAKSDSKFWSVAKDDGVYIGENDLNLAQRLVTAGTEHRKFLRQIMVSVDVTAPLYWWKEFDTYKIGTTANSTSTIHKLASTEIGRDCFETDNMNGLPDKEDNDFLETHVEGFLDALEYLRERYKETGDIRYWRELVRWLPEGWLQTRTLTMNYENLRNIYFQRRNHKLTEWHSFVDWLKTLPYSAELITYEKEKTE